MDDDSLQEPELLTYIDLKELAEISREDVSHGLYRGVVEGLRRCMMRDQGSDWGNRYASSNVDEWTGHERVELEALIDRIVYAVGLKFVAEFLGSCDEEPFRDVFKESLGQFSAQDWQFMFAEHAEVEPASILHGSRPEQARRSHELVDVAPENRSPELGRDRVLMGAVSRFYKESPCPSPSWPRTLLQLDLFEPHSDQEGLEIKVEDEWVGQIHKVMA
jgi:hypothetical protein